MQTILQKLFNKEDLTKNESKALFNAVIKGELSNEELAGALIALKFKSETINEISGAVLACLENAKQFDAPNYPFADIVGTGGDGANSINISTTCALVAGSLGLKIAKHGNRSVSSKTGSSDLLKELGVDIQANAQIAKKALDELGICFLFAPDYHLGFKNAIAVRQALKTRTIFNILGPLINPARPKRKLLGVYSKELLEIYAKACKELQHQHSIVVYGNGVDEVAIHDKTEVAEIINEEIKFYSLEPEDFGFTKKPLSSLQGGDAKQNAQIITAILQGKGEDAHNQAIAMNTALLMKIFGFNDLKENAKNILEHLKSGKAYQTMQSLVKITNQGE